MGQTQSFQPTWWRGEGGRAAGLFPCTEHSLCSRLQFTAFACIVSLNSHRNPRRHILLPLFFMSKLQLPKAGIVQGHIHSRTLIQNPPSARILGCPNPLLPTPSFRPWSQRPPWPWFHKVSGSRGLRCLQRLSLGPASASPLPVRAWLSSMPSLVLRFCTCEVELATQAIVQHEARCQSGCIFKSVPFTDV